LETIYYNNPVIQYYSKDNQGLGLTRNFGINISKGEYIFFLDVDDTLPSNAIEILINAIQDRDIAIGQCQRIFYNKNNKIDRKLIWKENLYENIDSHYEILVDSISTNKLYKKQFLLANNIFFNSGLYEDKLFVLKLLLASKKYIYLNQIVYHWHVAYKSKSITNQLTIQNLQARMKVIEECIHYTHNIKVQKIIIQNTITHDLQIYINNSYSYNIKDLQQFYQIYYHFIIKYHYNSRSISFGISILNLILQLIKSRLKNNIKQFLKIWRR